MNIHHERIQERAYALWVEDGRIQFRPDIYGLDATGFILGQPQPQGGT